jgi:hypothetical protein
MQTKASQISHYKEESMEALVPVLIKLFGPTLARVIFAVALKDQIRSDQSEPAILPKAWPIVSTLVVWLTG